ncbi:LemA family protein [Curvibacter sp. HBC61]|uniref:LemA family protein n=1 Tax=Curvibacter cyanobacteriorum TaxID=3026422 RepID=A0ABT5N1D9_9BURK|nr:LemA family protein [Curvibacter sp. HBC61]MDD0838838.1 LemA family protein [Curvibacter sp. HBC61]
MSWDDVLEWPIGVWITAALLLFWAVGAYNRLVRLRAAAVQAFSLLESQWLRHLAWIEVQTLPVPSDAGPQPPAGDWQVMLPAMAQFRACLQSAKAAPLSAERLAALASAWSVLLMAIRQTLAPDDAGALRVPEWLVPQWEQMMLQDQAAVDVFNAAITQYNEAIRQFPALLLAGLFGYRLARPL